MTSTDDYQALASLANTQIPLQPEFHDNLDDGASGTKRKAEDGGPPQQRAKRNRYISIACNECKRRKIKCNGQTPCQRCGNLTLECIYAPNCCNGFRDSAEYKDMVGQMASLQDQVNTLYNDLSNLRAQLGQPPPPPLQPPQHPHISPPAPIAQVTPTQQHAAIDPSLQSFYPSRSFAGPPASPGALNPEMTPVSQAQQQQQQRLKERQPSFRGPTSAAFNFDVAKSSLQTMGITGQTAVEGSSDEAGTGTANPTPHPSPPLPPRQALATIHRDKDPIWTLTLEEAVRLCRVYEDEMGLMYPVLDIEKMIAYTNRLFQFLEAARRTGLVQHGFPGADMLDDEDTNVLKLVLATALTVEAAGRSDLGRRLFDYVQPAIDNLLLGSVGVKGIRLLTMAAMYEFHRDNEGTSWRIIGLTARLCIELGLHRRETYEALPDDDIRSETLLLFWSIYVLDRRWSFGTGMPFALQDADIDPLLPRPEERSPYLSAMIQYSAIGSKVWRNVASTPGSIGQAINTDEMNYLDYQVIQWHRAIPPHLRFEHPAQAGRLSTPIGPAPSRAAGRLRVLLYLRANSMRIHIYRPVLHSATSIIQHREQAQTVVDVAKDTIRVLTHINHTSDLYRTQQMLFNAFLTSALAVLFLSVSHTPALFADNVREEFYMALDLVRGFSKGSWIGKRLWKTIRVLKEVGPKLGLPRHASDQKPHNRTNSQGAAAAKRPSNTGNSTEDMDPSRSAAVAMAGLAGHNIDELALFNAQHDAQGQEIVPQQQQQTPQTYSGNGLASASSVSPENMANELTSLFEAAGGLQAIRGMGNGEEGAWSVPEQQQGGSNGQGQGQGQGQGHGEDGAAVGWGGVEGEGLMNQILRELF